MPTLAKSTDCTGCSACYNACLHKAINMVADKEGFIYPQISKDKCVECKLCERSCPVITPPAVEQYEKPKAFALWSNPDRTLSSSGGAFSAFARLILDKGGVVFGASFDENLHVKHIEIDSVENLDRLRGSKYVQSNIGDVYQSIKKRLRQDRYVLFCGTPCQVAGLRAYLHKDFEKLLILDLACHGVPSEAVWQSYLSKLSAKFSNKKISHYDFRRRNGWGFQPSACIDNKKKLLYGIDSLYMSAFDKSALFRNCCYHCQYASSKRIGDCSIADFWGLGRQGIPFKHDVMKGVSLVLVNNDKGRNALSLLKDCFIEERPLDEALAQNANLNHPSHYNKDRDGIISAFVNPVTSLNDIDSQYHLVDHSIKGLVKEWSVRLNLFTPVKQLYNFVMANIHLTTNSKNTATKLIGGGKAHTLNYNIYVSIRRSA